MANHKSARKAHGQSLRASGAQPTTSKPHAPHPDGGTRCHRRGRLDGQRQCHAGSRGCSKHRGSYRHARGKRCNHTGTQRRVTRHGCPPVWKKHPPRPSALHHIALRRAVLVVRVAHRLNVLRQGLCETRPQRPGQPWLELTACVQPTQAARALDSAPHRHPAPAQAHEGRRPSHLARSLWQPPNRREPPMGPPPLRTSANGDPLLARRVQQQPIDLASQPYDIGPHHARQQLCRGGFGLDTGTLYLRTYPMLSISNVLSTPHNAPQWRSSSSDPIVSY